MKYRLVRRRYRLLLIALLAISALLFLETRIETLMPQLTIRVEEEIERFLGGRVDVAIGLIDGGIFRPFILHDIRLVDRENEKNPISFIEVESIALGFGLWELVSRSVKSPHPIKEALSQHVDITISSRQKDLTGFVRLAGAAGDMRLIGRINLFNKERVDFSGKIILSGPGRILFDVDVSPKKGSLKLNGAIIEKKVLAAHLKLNHLGPDDLDIVSDVNLKLKYKGRGELGGPLFEGEFETINLILNQRPFRDLRFSGRLRYDDGCPIVEITSLELGRCLKAYGKIFLKSPSYPIDLVVLADNLNPTPLLLDLKVSFPEITYFSGVVNARFELKGPLCGPSSKGRLEIKKGNLGDVYFESMSADLKGEGPLISIEDSRINRENGYLVLLGDFDLRRITKGDGMKDIEIVIDEENIIWEGWDITKERESYQVKMSKPVSDTLSFAFKTFVNDEKLDERYKTSEVELEYKLYQKDSMMIRIGQRSEFFGMEHKEKF